MDALILSLLIFSTTPFTPYFLYLTIRYWVRSSSAWLGDHKHSIRDDKPSIQHNISDLNSKSKY
jgi:hypothetical protein